MPPTAPVLAQISAAPLDVLPLGVVGNTLLLVAATAGISVPIGSCLALLITRTDLPGRRMLALLLGTLLLVPLYLQTGAWQAGFGLQGWYSVLAGGPELIRGLRGAIWVHAMAAIPWVALIVAAGLRLVEGNLEEEALLYGNTAQVFRRVTLRRSASSVLIALVWVAVSTAGEMTCTDLLRVRTYAEEIYIIYAATGDMDATVLELFPTILLAAVLLACGGLLAVWLMRPTRTITFRRPRRFGLGAWRWPLAAATAALVLVMFGLPLANLLFKAGIRVAPDATGSLVQVWQFSQVVDMVLVQPVVQFGRELRSSLAVAALSATAALLTAILLAGFASQGPRRAIVVCVVIAVLLAVPGPVIGVVVIRTMGRFPALYDSYAAPSAAIWLRTLPLATLIVWHAIRSLPRDLLDTATLDGARPLVRLWLVVVPARWPAMAAAWLVAALLAIGDLAASQLVLVPGKETLANRVFDRLHSGAYDQVSGLFLALLLGFGCIAGLTAWLLARQGRMAAGTSLPGPADVL